MEQEKNITFRVSESLKEKYIAACKVLGTTISKDIRKHMQTIINRVSKKEKQLNDKL